MKGIFNNRLKAIMILWFIFLALLIYWIFQNAKVDQEPKLWNGQFYHTCYASWQAPRYQEKEIEAVLSFYTPRVKETDSTPEITASGKKVKEGFIANNCLPFGSLVETSHGIFEVQDRMNKKYGCQYFDILTFDLEFAYQGGRKVETINVITF